MYDTLVNDQSGLRILEQSLIMQSISHQDVFDTLTLNSFGWGGDPQQAARVRVSKYHWYTFSGSYQHMQNYFDYDLFANPLNPPTGSPPLPILNSPHGYYNRQNLYNFDLVVLPMHRVSFRVDYNRNRFDGPAFSSIHEGTEALLNESHGQHAEWISLWSRLPRHQENYSQLHATASVLRRRNDVWSELFQFVPAV